MRLTIIRSDACVYVDGIPYAALSMSSVPLTVHALQWFDVGGWIEYNDGAPNEEIQTLPTWAETCVQEWQAAGYAHNNPPPPTPEELLASCKEEAKGRLADTDYSELPDVKAILVNSAEFTTYRTQIRDLYLNPVEHPVWPIQPKAVWATN